MDGKARPTPNGDRRGDKFAGNYSGRKGYRFKFCLSFGSWFAGNYSGQKDAELSGVGHRGSQGTIVGRKGGRQPS